MKLNTTWSPGDSHDTCSPTDFDHARALVPADAGQSDRHVAGDEVVVGVAHARGVQFDQYLGRLRRVELDGLDGPGRVAFEQDRCLGLHCCAQFSLAFRLNG